MAEQNATAVAITGGTINGTTIGATSASSVNATTITGQTEVLKGTGTNLFTQSSVLTNAVWTQTGVTLTGSQTDVFGGTTASLMNDGTSAGLHYLASANITVTSASYTYSIYAKAGTANYVGIYSSLLTQGVFFNLTTGAFTGNILNAPASYTSSNTGLASGWWRLSITVSSTAGTESIRIFMSEDGTNYSFTGTSKTITASSPQAEIGSTANTYIPTTTTAVYGTPTLSFSGVSEIGLLSNGALYLQPAGTGALQAQATTSTTAGGNARGSYAVDWQTIRSAASQVASGTYATLGGGINNTVGGFGAIIAGGGINTASATYAAIGGGQSNNAGSYSYIGSGQSNTASGIYNFIGGGFTNSGTSGSAVTTQSGTMNATTAVTLSGSNANIKVGQYISGTSIAADTYVAAISGTSLTLSKVASGSSTSTLSFFTPHGVVVGGGNNQATGAYSAILGGGDAGTAANRNTASGDWSFVGGGNNNTASGIGSVVVGGGVGVFSAVTGSGNVASGAASFIGGGVTNTASAIGSMVLGGVSNTANGSYSTVFGYQGSSRSITQSFTFATPRITVNGDSQAGLYIERVQTTDATATALTTNGSAAGTTNQVILPNNSAYFFRGEVISGVTGGGDTKGWTIEGVIKRGANAAATTLVGSTVTSLYADAGAATWAIAVTADTTNGGLRVTFTGQASTTIRTVCQIRTTEMTY
jgi:hypothetical protein